MGNNRPWRTNIGLRLTQETGAWLERQCAAENRTFANYVETLIMRDKAQRDPGRLVPHHGSGPAQVHRLPTAERVVAEIEAIPTSASVYESAQMAGAVTKFKEQVLDLLRRSQ